jgi:GT2 family glycosyltransferase
MTCHNRVTKTIACLERLFACDFPGFRPVVYLVDDGCTDGTGQIAKELYPEVNIIEGSGELYWSGGMRLAWEVASREDYDFYLWLNDDTLLEQDAFRTIMSASNSFDNKAIVCCSVRSEATGLITYGGKRSTADGYIVPDGTCKPCDIINGNCVLIPKYVFKALGNISNTFSHAIGDWDYGLRAKKLGIQAYTAPSFVGSCESNPRLPKWCRPEIPVVERVKSLYSPLAYAQPIPYFLFNFRHFGIALAVRQWITMHIRVIAPRLWKASL